MPGERRVYPAIDADGKANIVFSAATAAPRC